MTALKRKPIVVLLCLVLGAALFGASAMSWVHASVATAVSQIDADAVSYTHLTLPTKA